ncbi:hypothetical protein PO909_019165 [Leuciscus waleckii]
MLFVCLQSALTYRLAKTQGEYNMGHLRLFMTLLAFVALESFVLQHASAIFEWVFCVIIMLFYGTFAFEFAGISSDTMMVLARGKSLQSASRDHKMESLGGAKIKKTLQQQRERNRKLDMARTIGLPLPKNAAQILHIERLLHSLGTFLNPSASML